MLRKGRNRIELKSPAEIEKMRAAGRVVARTLDLLREAVRPGISTLELDALAEQSIREAGAIPSFKGYHGFPGSICASVNEEVVHGIPRATKVLADGTSSPSTAGPSSTGGTATPPSRSRWGRLPRRTAR